MAFIFYRETVPGSNDNNEVVGGVGVPDKYILHSYTCTCTFTKLSPAKKNERYSGFSKELQTGHTHRIVFFSYRVLPIFIIKEEDMVS